MGMTAQELILELSKLPPEKQVVLFDEESTPYEIDRVFCNESDHWFDHIVIKSISPA